MVELSRLHVYNTPDLFNINDSGLLCRCRVPGISGALCADNNGLCLAGTLLKGGGRPRFYSPPSKIGGV